MVHRAQEVFARVGSVASKPEALGSIPSTGKEKEEEEKRKHLLNGWVT
jgi:hypothetical protein